MSQQKRFVPVVPEGGQIIQAPYTPCTFPACVSEGYAYTFSYGQTGRVKFDLCPKHLDIVAGAVWIADQLGLIADGGCAHIQKQSVGQLGARPMLECANCHAIFLG